MKRLSVMIALGHIGCALLLFGSRATVMASSQDNALSEEPLKQGQTAKKSKKVSKEHLVEQAHHDDRQIARHNDELAHKHQDDRQVSRHANDNAISKHQDNVHRQDNFHERGKHDHYSSHGERDALIGTGVGVAISALHELNKPKETIYEGVPITTEKPVKSTKHVANRNQTSTISETWSRIDLLKKDSAQISDQPKPPLDRKTQDRAGKTRTAEEQAILDKEYMKAWNKLAAARDDWARGLRTFDPEIARMEEDLDRQREEDPGLGQDDAASEAQREEFYEGYLQRMAAAEKAWPKTAEGKAVADKVEEAKKEYDRAAGNAAPPPKPEEQNPANREEIH